MKARQYFTVDRPNVPAYLTVADTYAVVPFTIEGTENTRLYWDTFHLPGMKKMRFAATTKDLLVKINGSLDGSSFTEVIEAEFSVLVTTPVVKSIPDYYCAIEVQVKPASSGQNGTLNIKAIGTTLQSNGDMGQANQSLASMTSTTCTHDHITIVVAGTEYSKSIPSNCKKLSFRTVLADGKTPGSDLLYDFTTGNVDHPTNYSHFLLDGGAVYSESNLLLTGKTLYVAGTTAGDIVLLEMWT